MRGIIVVKVDTDQVLGWGYDIEDFAKHIRKYLDETIPHYNPSVRAVPYSRETIEESIERTP